MGHLQCIVDKVNTTYQCMVDNGYLPCDITLSLKIAAGLIIWGMAGRSVSSIGLKGLSKSWTAQSIKDVQNSLRSSLSIFDPEGCTSSVTPPNPTASLYFAVTDGSSC